MGRPRKPGGKYDRLVWRAQFYDDARWKRRREQQLQSEPLCRLCAAKGVIAVATIVDHVVPHHGDRNLFELGELQSLCKPCHDSTKRVFENRGYSPEVGLDGWPTDRNHPANRHSST